MRYEIARDKPMELLTDNHTEDVQLWNDFLQQELDRGKSMKMIKCFFFLSTKLKEIDSVGFKVVGY